MVDFEQKEKYDFDDLLRIMEILRAPDGCMWDREQDHASIRRNFIEETYEVCEAIDEQDADHLKEELGDVLLQVVFHTQMEKEKGVFDIGDVADGVCKKLIFRHPHFRFSRGWLVRGNFAELGCAQARGKASGDRHLGAG